MARTAENSLPDALDAPWLELAITTSGTMLYRSSVSCSNDVSAMVSLVTHRVPPVRAR